MLKPDLCRNIAEQHPDLGLGRAERVCSAILDRICSALRDGSRVELRGFGTLSTTTHQARVGRNPKTGAPVTVPEKRAILFRPGRGLRKRLGNG